MRSGNPALNSKTFAVNVQTDEKMTLGGTVNKTAILLALVLITAAWTWGKFFETENRTMVFYLMGAGVLGGLVVGLITVFFKQIAPYTAPIYALLEGLAVGGISATFEAEFQGIVIQAVCLTFGTLLCLLAAYKSGL